MSKCLPCPHIITLKLLGELDYQMQGNQLYKRLVPPFFTEVGPRKPDRKCSHSSRTCGGTLS